MVDNNVNVHDQNQVRRTMLLAVIDGILLILFLLNSGGPIATNYAIKLGADQSTIGILLSMPLITQGFSIFAPWLAGLFGKRKGLAVATAIIGRLIWGLAIFAPFWFSSTPQVGWFVALIGLSNIFLAINTSLWFDWIGCVVPSNQCSSYFAWRAGITTLFGTGLNIILSRFLDLNGSSIGNLQTVLAAGVILALIGSLTLVLYFEPKILMERTSIFESVKEPFKNKNFVKIMIFSFMAMFAVFMLVPATQTYLLNEIRINMFQIAGWMSITALVGFFFARSWGKILNLSGNKPMLYLSIMAIGILVPILYILASSKSVWSVFAAAPIEAFFPGIIAPAILTLTFRSAAGRNQSSYVAVYLLITGLGSSLGAMSFGPLYNFLEQFKFIFLGIDFNGYRLIYVVNMVVKMASLGFLAMVKEENAWSVKQTVKYILASVFKRRKSDLNE